MSTPDPLEEKLLSLPRRGLPPEWRAQILRKTARPHVQGPPRWLAWGWGAGIAASVILYLLTPHAVPVSSQALAPQPSPAESMQDHAQLLQTWLALNETPALPQP